jgi:hypothetical protein
MGGDTAALTPNIPEGAITPDVAFGVLGMTLDKD